MCRKDKCICWPPEPSALPLEHEPAPKGAQIIDLMQALKDSLKAHAAHKPAREGKEEV